MTSDGSDEDMDGSDGVQQSGENLSGGEGETDDSHMESQSEDSQIDSFGKGLSNESESDILSGDSNEGRDGFSEDEESSSVSEQESEEDKIRADPLENGQPCTLPLPIIYTDILM